jgi:hypothetical protein
MAPRQPASYPGDTAERQHPTCHTGKRDTSCLSQRTGTIYNFISVGKLPQSLPAGTDNQPSTQEVSSMSLFDPDDHPHELEGLGEIELIAVLPKKAVFDAAYLNGTWFIDARDCLKEVLELDSSDWITVSHQIDEELENRGEQGEAILNDRESADVGGRTSPRRMTWYSIRVVKIPGVKPFWFFEDTLCHDHDYEYMFSDDEIEEIHRDVALRFSESLGEFAKGIREADY